MPAKSASVEPAPARANGATSASPVEKSKPVYKIDKTQRADILYDREQKSLDDRVKEGTLKNAAKDRRCSIDRRGSIKERRESVSSEKNLLKKMDAGVRLRSYERPDTLKDPETTEMLRAACVKSILFSGMSRQQQELIIQMFTAVRTRRHDVVIEQGEALTGGDGDNFYIVGEGSFDIFRDATMTVLPEGAVEKHQLKEDEVVRGRSSTSEFVQHRHAGDTFGELALMYSCPRQATVMCASDTAVLWALPREVRSCVKESACKRKRLVDHPSLRSRTMRARACRSLCAAFCLAFVVMPHRVHHSCLPAYMYPCAWVDCVHVGRSVLPSASLSRSCRTAFITAEYTSGLAGHRCTARWLRRRQSTQWTRSPKP